MVLARSGSALLKAFTDPSTGDVPPNSTMRPPSDTSGYGSRTPDTEETEEREEDAEEREMEDNLRLRLATAARRARREGCDATEERALEITGLPVRTSVGVIPLICSILSS